MSNLTAYLERMERAGQRIAPLHLFDLARQQGFTGAVTVHYFNGKPMKAEVGRQVQIVLIDQEITAEGVEKGAIQTAALPVPTANPLTSR